MILDVLENASRYLPLAQGFEQAFVFLSRADLQELPVGRHEIDGDRVFALVAKDSGRQKSDALLETHEKYIDIQFVLSGADDMGWKAKAGCRQPTADYNPETDVQFFADQPDAFIPTPGGVFAIFFPEDAHMPMISSGQLHKVIVKIAIDPK